MERTKTKPPLPFGWTVHFSATYPDRVYYFNEFTNCTTWKLPISVDDRPSSPSEPPSPRCVSPDEGPPSPEPDQAPERLFVDDDEQFLLMSDDEDEVRKANASPVPSVCESTFLNDDDVDNIVLGLRKPQLPELLRKRPPPMLHQKPSPAKPSTSETLPALKPALKNFLDPALPINSKNKTFVRFKSTVAEKTYIINSKISKSNDPDNCSELTEDYYESVQSKRPIREIAIDFRRATNSGQMQNPNLRSAFAKSQEDAKKVITKEKDSSPLKTRQTSTSKSPVPNKEITDEKFPQKTKNSTRNEAAKDTSTKMSPVIQNKISPESLELRKEPKNCEKRGVKRSISSESSSHAKKCATSKQDSQVQSHDAEAQKLLLFANFKIPRTTQTKPISSNGTEDLKKEPLRGEKRKSATERKEADHLKSDKLQNSVPNLRQKEIPRHIFKPRVRILPPQASPALSSPNTKSEVPSAQSVQKSKNRELPPESSPIQNSPRTALLEAIERPLSNKPTTSVPRNKPSTDLKTFYSQSLDPRIPRIPKIANRSPNISPPPTSDVSNEIIRSPCSSNDAMIVSPHSDTDLRQIQSNFKIFQRTCESTSSPSSTESFSGANSTQLNRRSSPFNQPFPNMNQPPPLFAPPHRPHSFVPPQNPPQRLTSFNSPVFTPPTSFQRIPMVPASWPPVLANQTASPSVPLTDLRLILNARLGKNKTSTSPLISDRFDDIFFGDDNNMTKEVVKRTPSATPEVNTERVDEDKAMEEGEKDENHGPADFESLEEEADTDVQFTKEEDRKHSWTDNTQSRSNEASNSDNSVPQPVAEKPSFSSMWGDRKPKVEASPSVRSFGDYWSGIDKEVDLEEDMEWEGASSESSEHTRDFSLPEDLYISFPIDSWHVIVDTNILLYELNFVAELRDSLFKDRGCPNIVLPWVVFQELDSLKEGKKDGKKKQIDFPTINKARAAVSFVHTNLSSDHPRFKGQSYTEYSQHKYHDTANNDDKILHFCCTLQRKGRKVTLLTEDKNLCNKALASRIEAATKNILQQRLQKLVSIPDPTIVKASHKTETVPELSFMQETQETDKIFCQTKLILHDILDEVLKQEMKREFKSMWERMVVKKPPWTLEDVFVCIKKHWIAVFSQKLPKNTINVIESIEDTCFKFKMKKGFELNVVDIRGFVETCRSLFMYLTQIKDQDRKVTKAIAKLDALLRRCNTQQYISSEASLGSSMSFMESPTNLDNEDSFSQHSDPPVIPTQLQMDTIEERYQTVWEKANVVCKAFEAVQSNEENPDKSRLLLAVERDIGQVLMTTKLVTQLNQKMLDGGLDSESAEARELHSVLVGETLRPELDTMGILDDPFTVETLCLYFAQHRELLENTQKEFHKFISKLNSGVHFLMSKAV